ncbi:two-component system response regulator [Amylibacter kogurei]|uniref:Two-component system response regulator n=1 Tax=Paramylibacter kogurei TaxID=1889778 RepID=A0A2G5K6K3_9RHOB|nr:ANTAR domain-containing protein [Amylibacter kogurei]PIB25171.1 two-component system response regulator [Amylibacter kogurei]
MTEPLHIVVIDPDKERAFLIVDGLRETMDYKISVIGETLGLARKLRDLEPDIILIDLEDPSRDSFEQVITALGPSERPVAMFVDQTDDKMMRAAIDAGVSAYVVNGLRKDRIKPVLETAIARFHSFGRMKAELEATKTALAERKTIDRAKGLLMKARGLSEEEAYAVLRKTAMDQGRRVSEVADGLVTAAGLLL